MTLRLQVAVGRSHAFLKSLGKTLAGDVFTRETLVNSGIDDDPNPRHKRLTTFYGPKQVPTLSCVLF